MPGVFPDYPAPVVRNTDTGREMMLMRWGMPPPDCQKSGLERSSKNWGRPMEKDSRLPPRLWVISGQGFEGNGERKNASAGVQRVQQIPSDGSAAPLAGGLLGAMP
jgi:hypothetical protein